MGAEANVYVKKQILAFEGENYFNMLWIKYFTVPWKSPCFFIFPVCFAEIFYLIFSEKSIISAGSFIFLVFKRLHCALKITWISLLWLNYCIGSYTDKTQAFTNQSMTKFMWLIQQFCLELSSIIFNPIW